MLQRVLVAKKLYDQQLAPRILMSGRWSVDWDPHPPTQTEAALMYQYALSLDIPKKALFLEEHSQNTAENAFYITKLFLEPKNWKKVIVITSDFHVSRTKNFFAKLLGADYKIKFVGAHTNEGLMKQLQRHSKELIHLHAEWLFQYLFNGR